MPRGILRCVTPTNSFGQTLSMTFGDRDDFTIQEFADVMAVIATTCENTNWLGNYAAGERLSPWSTTRRSFVAGVRGASPDVARVVKQSPLLVDLLFATIPAGTTAGVMFAALKNPRAVGAWLPDLASGWHDARARAIRARMDALEAESALASAVRREAAIRELRNLGEDLAEVRYTVQSHRGTVGGDLNGEVQQREEEVRRAAMALHRGYGLSRVELIDRADDALVDGRQAFVFPEEDDG